MKQYIALFESDGHGGYGVVFPDLPGLTSAGDTYDDAVRNAHQALAFYADDEPDMPVPRTLEQIKQTWPDWKTWAKEYDFTVGIVDLLPTPVRNRRINITMDDFLLRRIDMVSHNRSEFISNAVRGTLGLGATAA